MSPAIDPAHTYYDMLGVARTATPEEIRKAHHKLARDLHPDVNAGDLKKEERLKQINRANDVLGDRGKRIEYDEQLDKVMGALREAQRRDQARAEREKARAQAPGPFSVAGAGPSQREGATSSAGAPAGSVPPRHAGPTTSSSGTAPSPGVPPPASPAPSPASAGGARPSPPAAPPSANSALPPSLSTARGPYPRTSLREKGVVYLLASAALVFVLVGLRNAGSDSPAAVGPLDAAERRLHSLGYRTLDDSTRNPELRRFAAAPNADVDVIGLMTDDVRVVVARFAGLDNAKRVARYYNREVRSRHPDWSTVVRIGKDIIFRPSASTERVKRILSQVISALRLPASA